MSIRKRRPIFTDTNQIRIGFMLCCGAGSVFYRIRFFAGSDSGCPASAPALIKSWPSSTFKKKFNNTPPSKQFIYLNICFNLPVIHVGTNEENGVQKFSFSSKLELEPEPDFQTGYGSWQNVPAPGGTGQLQLSNTVYSRCG